MPQTRYFLIGNRYSDRPANRSVSHGIGLYTFPIDIVISDNSYEATRFSRHLRRNDN